MRLHEAERIAQAAGAERDTLLLGDSQRKREHGIVHTPPELARFVVRAVHDLLLRLGVPDGLFDARVHVVDPACGPGAFVGATLAFAAEQGRVVTRITAVDLDGAALDAAAALRPFAEQAGTRLELLHADALRDSGALTSLAAHETCLVLIGNPPWSVARSQPTPAMQALLEDFRRDAQGERLPERKLGVLADAYVRFLRICTEAARASSGGSAIGLVTNASFLDGPVHRGMRGALCAWFDMIDVIDLGGNALLARAAGGRRDDNVFGVRTSTTITLLGRPSRHAEAPGAARLRYTRLFGDRQAKLDAMATLATRATRAAGATDTACGLDYVEVRPSPPLLRFVPAPAGAHGGGYGKLLSLAQAMPFHREGVQTNRDALVIERDRDVLLERLHAIASGRESEADRKWLAPRAHFDPARARRRLAEVIEQDPRGTKGLLIRPIAYRPFDLRYFVPVFPLCHRPRPDLLAAFDHEALALISVRKDRGDVPYAHFGASDCVIDNCYLSTRSSCRARAFPVRNEQGAENLEPLLKDQLQQRLGHAVDAAAWLHYSLAVLASPTYRVRFGEELRLDYPRIPWPDSSARFIAVQRAGSALARLFIEPVASMRSEAPRGLRANEADASSLRIGHFAPGLAKTASPELVERLAHMHGQLRALDEDVTALLDAQP